jgi:hypothetical protein
MGRPAEGYPHTWSVYEWLPGANANGTLHDLDQAAADLAAFITALRRIDTAGAPPRAEGARGAPLAELDDDWISGFELACGASLLVHDCQYSDEEYPAHVGWGHSSIGHALALGEAAEVRRLVAFHHDPGHNDRVLDRLYAEAAACRDWPFELIPAREGNTFTLGRTSPATDRSQPVVGDLAGST